MNTPNDSRAIIDDETRYADDLQGAEMVLRFLGSALGDDPGLGTIQLVRDPDFLGDIPFAGDNPNVQKGIASLEEWGTSVAEADDETLRAEAAEEWFRICATPGRAVAPPWQSYYTDEESLLFSKETLQVRKWYKKYGLQSGKLNQEPDDHIAIMLSFLAFLAHEELEALNRGDSDAVAKLQKDQRAFLADHVQTFLPIWAERIVANSGNALYTGLALLTLGSIDERCNSLADSLD